MSVDVLPGPLVVTLPCPGNDVTAVIGGKAAGIDRLLRAGFTVPPTAVISAAAYRRFLAAAGPPRQLIEKMRTGDADPDAAEVDATFLAAAVPDDVAAEILATVRAMSEHGPIAMRSSATVEDMSGFSFAGQYRSFLDVDPQDGDEILRVVRLVWASLWHPAPRAYRRAWGFDEERAAMAVLLMQMVPARSAGVAFSIDPGGTVENIRVEAVSGLGDDLVSGRRTPEVWLAPRRDLASFAPPEPVATAATLVLRVEEALGSPQDVEWAWDGETVWLVQARPITATGGDQCDTPVDSAELSPTGIEEMLPGVLPPLLWDVTSFCVEEGFRALLSDIGVSLPKAASAHAVLRRVRGRAALDLDLLKAAAGTLPGVGANDIEQGYFGTGAGTAGGPAVSTVAGPATARRLRRHSPSHDLRLLAARRRALAEGDVVLVATADLVADPPAPVDLDDPGLLTYRLRLLDLLARATAAEIAVAAVSTAAYRHLEAMLSRHLAPDVAAAFAQRLSVGSGVVRPVSADSSMSVPGGPTWRETGTDLPTARLAHGAPAWEVAEEELEHALVSLPGWRRTRILTGQFVDVRVHSLRRLAADARDRLGERDAVKAAVLAVGGLLRGVHLEIGRRLADRKLLAEPTDVDLLRDGELRAALVQGAVPPPAQLTSRRRHLTRYEQAGPLPSRFVGVPAAQADTTAESGDVLSGWAASPGRYTGRARVLSRPDKSALRQGDIVVAHATDAAWTPVFLMAGAIVVERGGPLSHAALVARELGIPAVLNVPEAATVLDGRQVTVDGDRGSVVVHDRNTPHLESEGASA